MTFGSPFVEIQIGLYSLSGLLFVAAGIILAQRYEVIDSLKSFFLVSHSDGDKRRERRVRCKAAIQMLSADGPATGLLLNLSSHGACLATAHELKRDQRIMTWLNASAGMSTGMSARVVWTRKLADRHLCGIRFDTSVLTKTEAA